MNGDERPMVLVDVRTPDEYGLFSLPGAINIPANQILEHRYTQFLESADHRIVFYSNSNTLATEAWLAASRAGIENLLVLEGGLNGFVHTIFYYEPENGSKNMSVINRNRFRENARNYFLSGKAAPDEKSAPVPVIKLIEVEMPPSGGC